MAVGAQLRLVVLGGDAKHVVAGDADAVDNLLRLGCRFDFGFLFLSHNRILAHRRERGGAGIGAGAASAWCGWRWGQKQGAQEGLSGETGEWPWSSADAGRVSSTATLGCAWIFDSK